MIALEATQTELPKANAENLANAKFLWSSTEEPSGRCECIVLWWGWLWIHHECLHWLGVYMDAWSWLHDELGINGNADIDSGS